MAQRIRLGHVVTRWIPLNLDSQDRYLRSAVSREMIPVREGCHTRSRKRITTRDESVLHFSSDHSGKWIIGPDDHYSVPSRALKNRKVMYDDYILVLFIHYRQSHAGEDQNEQSSFC
jgi:hypothetical protein